MVAKGDTKKTPEAKPSTEKKSTPPSPIKIKPSHEGLFTAKADKAGMSVQAFAARVLANPKVYDAATVKQANFAKNAKSWGK